MDLKKLFGYEGKNVVITGAASGMSMAATKLLLELGANVYAIDINKIELPVTKSYQADLSKKEEIDKVVEELPEKIVALFLCHGIAYFPGREMLVQKVNFYGQKYMVEQLLERISDHGSVTFISSVGGFGWQQVYEKAVELINLPTWEDAMQWYEEHPDLIQSAYVFAKQCLESYVTYKCMSKEFIDRRIRLNAINPGDTITGLTEDFNKATSPKGDVKEGEEMISNIFLKSWNGYAAKPEEMGHPLVVIGSNICSYMSGQLIYIDFGLTSTWTSGALLHANEKSIEEISKEAND
ncbi:MAG: SDR family oxidoreductase [Bacilli bacterium]|nr:SDR family oxidoreductase [Bacilli bacterium]